MSLQRVEKRKMRQGRIRRTVRGTDAKPRLSVFRSLRHIYAQVISDQAGVTLVSSSTMKPEQTLKNGCSIEAAKAVGTSIAQRCSEKGITEVVFDRNGFLYHGRVKALAEAAREAGLKF